VVRRQRFPKTVRYTLIIPGELLAKARIQAFREGMDVAKWMRDVLSEATRHVHIRFEETPPRRTKAGRR
jgi:hypothetical protein